MALVTLTTDFGLDDYYVAAVKGTLLRLAPGTTLVDVSHTVAPGDVEGAADLLAAAAPAFPAGTVHLAVVDPGVGSSRRILAVRTDAAWLIAPDNGLLTPWLRAGAPPPEVRSVERREVFLEAPGDTFHGRDRFAPVAAHLARGEPFEALGPRLDEPVHLDLPPPRREGERLVGRVSHVDRFGNLITDLPTGWLPDAPVEVTVDEHATRRQAHHYAEIPPGEAAWIPGSRGTVELSLNGASLAAHWGVRRGAAVVICPR